MHGTDALPLHRLGKCLVNMTGRIACHRAMPADGSSQGAARSSHTQDVPLGRSATQAESSSRHAAIPARSTKARRRKGTCRSPQLSMSPPPTVMTHPDVRLFQVNIPQEDLDDLRQRIATSRRPAKELVADAS
jgi:hypothetical protein